MNWFYSMPVPVQVVIIIIVILSVIIISIYGGINIQKNKDNISIAIGGDKKKEKKDNRDSNNKIERKCEDCFMIIREHLIKVERTIRSLEESKISKAMNYIDQNLEEYTSILISDYLNYMNRKATDKEKETGETIKELRLYEAHIRDGCSRIKKEIRRALLENGFMKLTIRELNCYINSEINRIIEIIPHHIRSVYPSSSSCMIIDMDEVLKLIKKREEDLIKVIEDFFMTVTDMIKEINKEIEEIEERSNKWCYSFILDGNKEISLKM